MTYINETNNYIDPTAGAYSAAVITLTATQILNLRATPIQLLPAPTTGYTYMVTNAFGKLTYGGTNPFTNAQNFNINFNGIVGNLLTFTTAGWIDLSANAYKQSVGGVINSITGIEATKIIIQNSGASEITGNAALDNTISIAIYYNLVKI